MCLYMYRDTQRNPSLSICIYALLCTRKKRIQKYIYVLILISKQICTGKHYLKTIYSYTQTTVRTNTHSITKYYRR